METRKHCRNNKKARMGNSPKSLEKYYIFLASKQQTHMNAFNIDHGNPIFEVILQTLTKQLYR
jgi:hypothetical protein